MTAAFVESETGIFFNMALVKKAEIDKLGGKVLLTFIDNSRGQIPLKRWERFYVPQQPEPQSEPKTDEDAPSVILIL